MKTRVLFLFAIGLLAGAGGAQPPAPAPAPQAIPDATQPLAGTLFFTREQRERLDKARKRGEIIDESGAVAPETPPVIGGYLRRSDGKTTVWVDGKAYADREPALVRRIGPADIGGEKADRIKILIPSEASPTAPAKKKVLRAVRPSAAKPVHVRKQGQG